MRTDSIVDISNREVEAIITATEPLKRISDYLTDFALQ
jgi:hypothetical protein